MPRNTRESALPWRAGATADTAMLAAIGVNTAPAPISTRPASSTGRDCARPDISMPAQNSPIASCSAVRRDQRPVRTSSSGASSAVDRA